MIDLFVTIVSVEIGAIPVNFYLFVFCVFGVFSHRDEILTASPFQVTYPTFVTYPNIRRRRQIQRQIQRQIRRQIRRRIRRQIRRQIRGQIRRQFRRRGRMAEAGWPSQKKGLKKFWARSAQNFFRRVPGVWGGLCPPRKLIFYGRIRILMVEYNGNNSVFHDFWSHRPQDGCIWSQT